MRFHIRVHFSLFRFRILPSSIYWIPFNAIDDKLELVHAT